LDYLDLARFAVEIAQNEGASASEAYLLDADSLTIEVAEQRLDTLKLAKDTGIGLRVISNSGTVGFAYSTTMEQNEIRHLVKQALNNSRKSFHDEFHKLPQLMPSVPAMELLDPKLSSMTVEDKIQMARDLENAARATDHRVTKAERCIYQDAQYKVYLANSNGLALQYRAGYCGLYGSILAAETGDVQSGMALDYTRNYDELDPERVGREAAEQAIKLLGAKSIKTAKVPLILSPYVSANFLSVLVPSFSADAVQKGKSIFQGKLQEKVVSSMVTITDDGTLTGGIATAPFDGEGVPAQRTILLNRGVLQGYLYNSYTAARDGAVSTGNGVRNSFKSVTEVGPTNIFIEAGEIHPDQIICEVENGFYVTSVMGLHTANPISGDFSLGAAGVWIKNGKVSHAVRGVAIAGNILDLFSKVEAVGSDLRFFGSQGAPTLRISNITVSGD
jgi:PmbA protein